MPELEFTTQWFTRKIPHWTRLLAPYAARPGLRFLEIGSWEGQSACWLLQNVLTDPSSSLTCVDTFAGSPEILARPDFAETMPRVEDRFDRNIAAVGAESRTIKRKGPSREVLRSLALGEYDCVYVDGSHEACDLLTDAVLSWDLLTPDGLLILDDYRLRSHVFFVPPSVGVEAFLAAFRCECDVIYADRDVFLRKRPRVVADASVPSPNAA